MTPFRALIIFFIAAASIVCPGAAANGETLTALSGSVSRPPLDELAALFRQETGINLQITYGGSGEILSQLILSRRGDIYIPASPDFMQKAMDKDVVEGGGVVRLAYIFPAILVQAGNPREIKGLRSLAMPGLRVAIANPRTVAAGLYAVELLEANSLAKEVKPNIVTYSENYEKALNLVALKAVDAVIGWQQVPRRSLKKVEVVPLAPAEIKRVAYISAAATNFTRHKEEAARFLDFLTSERARAVFRRHGFPTTEEEVRGIAPGAVIGGVFQLPEGW